MPREQVRLPPGALDLETLRVELVQTLASLDTMLAKAAERGTVE